MILCNIWARTHKIFSFPSWALLPPEAGIPLRVRDGLERVPAASQHQAPNMWMKSSSLSQATDDYTTLVIIDKTSRRTVWLAQP